MIRLLGDVLAPYGSGVGYGLFMSLANHAQNLGFLEINCCWTKPMELIAEET